MLCIFVFRSLFDIYIYTYIFKYLLNTGESRKRRTKSYKSKQLQSQDDDEKKPVLFSDFFLILLDSPVFNKYLKIYVYIYIE